MKKKLLRNASLVALSAVMVCGTAFGLAGCNNKNTNTISISMFCGVDDRAINEAACNTWAEQYTQELIANGTWEEGHEPIKIDFSSDANTDSYFSTLMNQIASNSQPDVFYVSPKYVRTWSHIGRILDLSDYLAEDNETLSDIWDDSLAFYAYSESEEYQRGERIEYDEATGTYVGQNSGAEVGIYGLPKDFSNFGLSYNAIFFTDEVREALTTVTTNDRTGIRGAEYETANQTFFGEPGVVTNPDGSDAPLINIGVPTTYKPYNFYRFASWEDALNGGDPMAWMVQLYTGGKGYTVTIPGFPGDTLEEAKKYWKDGANFDTTIPQDYQNAEAEYDESRLTSPTPMPSTAHSPGRSPTTSTPTTGTAQASAARPRQRAERTSTATTSTTACSTSFPGSQATTRRTSTKIRRTSSTAAIRPRSAPIPIRKRRSPFRATPRWSTSSTV